MAFDKAKFLARFIEEAGEHANSLNEAILLLEQNPHDTEILNQIFRSAHTIKGSSRMMKLITLSDFAHQLEDVFDALRKQEIQFNKKLVSLMLEGVKVIIDMLAQISAGNETVEPPKNICRALEKALVTDGLNDQVQPGVSLSAQNISAPLKSGPKQSEPAADTSPPVATDGPTETVDGNQSTGIFITAAEIQPKSEPTTSSDPRETVKVTKPPPDLGKKPKPMEILRINADKLDELIKLMGEIVSGNSQAWQRLALLREIELNTKKHYNSIAALGELKDFSDNTRTQILNSAESLCLQLKNIISLYREDLNVQSLLTGDLQDRALKMRMLPLSSMFDSFRVTVRNMAVAIGKDIDFCIEGGQTELDKKIIEQIGDSLLHMIRNSIDHGIESAQVRRQAGKPETGTIRLKAAYEGGNAAIEISDDGAGLPIEKIKQKAIQKGLYDEESIRGIPESEIVNLIFSSDFSTAAIITDFSGRGVGMDVVRKNIIENLKGSIQVDSIPGQGVTFYIKLPLTMAIINVLYIISADTTYAIPINYIREITKVPVSEVIQVTDKMAIRLRERIIPIMNLSDILMPLKNNTADVNKDESQYLILIASFGNEEFGLVVDFLLHEENVVIKLLPAHIANTKFVSGCVVSRDNEIINVLNIPGIIAEARDVKTKPRGQAAISETTSKTIKRILVVDDSLSTREIEKGILESYGYNVKLAGDGVEGFEAAQAEQFDLIITDVEMPRLNGLALTEKLRQSERYQDTPIILVTSLDKEEDKKKGILAGADAYIVKGNFEQTTLIETVENLIG